MRIRALVLVALGAVLPLGAPRAARADAYRQILSVYEAQGSIPPCRFSSLELETALRDEDAYGAEYFADFTQAIQTALDQRAAGGCLRRSRPPARPARRAAAGPAVHLPSSPTSATDAPFPLPLLLLGALAAAAGLVAALAALAQSLVWDPGWAKTMRHALAEAAFRLEGWTGSVADFARAIVRRHAAQ